MKNFTVMLLIFGICMLWATPQAEALSCTAPAPVKEELNKSDVVFKGKAVAVQEDGLTLFKIDKVWKGVETSKLEIYHNGWDPFIEDKVYLVFGSVQEGILRMNLCGRTGPWDDAKEAAMKTSGFNSINPGFSLGVTLSTIIVVMVVIFAFIRSKRKK